MAENEVDEDRPLTPGEQAAHFVKACSRSQTKLVTILRADLQRALADATPANEFVDYVRGKADEAATKYVSIIRSKLLAACRGIVEAAGAGESEEQDGNEAAGDGDTAI